MRRRSSTGVRSAPPPNQALRGDDEARVHVHGRHVRVPGMGDQRNARGPEARVLGGARDLLAEFRRELAEARSRRGRRPSRRRGPCSIAMAPPPPGCAGMVGAGPRLAHETARRVVRHAGEPRAGRPRAPRKLAISCRPAASRTRSRARPCAGFDVRLRSVMRLVAAMSRPLRTRQLRHEPHSLPQRLAQHHGGRDRDIERAQARRAWARDAATSAASCTSPARRPISRPTMQDIAVANGKVGSTRRAAGGQQHQPARRRVAAPGLERGERGVAHDARPDRGSPARRGGSAGRTPGKPAGSMMRALNAEAGASAAASCRYSAGCRAGTGQG